MQLKPLTTQSLNIIRQTLEPAIWKRSFNPSNRPSANAAVLIPFCNVQDTPGILFQLRGQTLRSHSGEVSFPGGRVDQGDESFVATALRETHEELGIPPSCIEILGQIGPPEVNLRGDMTVWPFVVQPLLSTRLELKSFQGFIQSSKLPSLDLNDPLPSIDLKDLKISRSEVDLAFHLSLSALTAPPRLRSSLFRGHRPYYSVNVTNVVRGNPGQRFQALPLHNAVDDTEIGSGKVAGTVEIWGLTGWFLTLLMRTLKLYP